jgi:hypothetical protein
MAPRTQFHDDEYHVVFFAELATVVNFALCTYPAQPRPNPTHVNDVHFFQNVVTIRVTTGYGTELH